MATGSNRVTGDFALSILQSIEGGAAALDLNDIAWFTPPGVRDAFVVTCDVLRDPSVWQAPLGQCLAACFCLMRSQARRNGQDGMLWNVATIAKYVVPVLWRAGAVHAAAAIQATAAQREQDESADETASAAATATPATVAGSSVASQAATDPAVAAFLDFRAQSGSLDSVFAEDLVDEVLSKLYELARTEPRAFDDPL